MHICFITNEYPKAGYPHGGVGTFVKTFATDLVNAGHKVTVLGINNYTNGEDVENDKGIVVFRLRPKRIKGLTWYFNSKAISAKLRQIHAKTAIDIIETTELGLAFISKIKAVKYVIRLHGGHHFFAESEQRGINKWKGFQEKRSFKKTDAFIAVSKYVKSHTSKYLSYHNKPIAVIKNAINLAVFKPKNEIKIIPNSLLFAGTICEKKGVEQLVRAMENVLEQKPEVNLYLFGRDWVHNNGKSYIDYIKNEVIPQLQVDHTKIHFMGSVPLEKLAKHYASAEVCVFPSLMETQGLVAPEAMAMGKLVVFSELGPGPETISHQKTGLLCNPYEIDDIAEKIIWALEHKDQSALIAAAGQHYVLDHFDSNKLMNANVSFYKRLLN
ncbi:glycosyltransferase family 4 protein [uncultured Winogradskyella sp.]|uniref:glycosyltransferase family 4 protein n=1 Tax=uncultured Winogradskyella sp. TaxID=395353 RepID=UPI002638BF06|nr:glycosyltransferase family 4 protein [uncultured Winogradskyella sp.]